MVVNLVQSALQEVTALVDLSVLNALYVQLVNIPSTTLQDRLVVLVVLLVLMDLIHLPLELVLVLPVMEL